MLRSLWWVKPATGCRESSNDPCKVRGFTIECSRIHGNEVTTDFGCLGNVGEKDSKVERKKEIKEGGKKHRKRGRKKEGMMEGDKEKEREGT
jgi:hypothetical protein